MKKGQKTIEEGKESKKRSFKQIVKDILKPSHMVIDFGSDSIKVVYGNFGRKDIEIFAHSVISVGRDLVDDGKVLNPLEVATLLKQSVDSNNIKVSDLTLILSGSEIIIREIQVPKVDEKEVGKIIEFEAQQYFPIELTEYMIDYKVLDEVNTDEEDKLRVLLVAVPLEQIQGYVKVAEYLGVELKAIDILINTTLKYFLGNNYLKEYKKDDVPQEFNFSNIFRMDAKSALSLIRKFMKTSLKNFKKGDNTDEETSEDLNEEEKEPGKLDKVVGKLKELSENILSKVKIKKEVQDTKEKKKEVMEKGDIYALLDMGARTTSIYIYSDYRLRFNRTLLIGGDEIDREISNNLTMSNEDAKSQKVTRGNLIVDEGESQLYEDEAGFNKVLTDAFGKILGDAARFLEFYNSRSTQGNINKIYIYGGASKLRGAKEYMTEFFNVPVEYLEDGHYKVKYTGSNKDDYELNKRSLVNVIGGLVK